MTFLITFGQCVRPNLEYVRGLYLRIVVGPVGFWWMNRDFEKLPAFHPEEESP
jgi:hypothetical protein